MSNKVAIGSHVNTNTESWKEATVDKVIQKVFGTQKQFTKLNIRILGPSET